MSFLSFSSVLRFHLHIHHRAHTVKHRLAHVMVPL